MDMAEIKELAGYSRLGVEWDDAPLKSIQALEDLYASTSYAEVNTDRSRRRAELLGRPIPTTQRNNTLTRAAGVASYMGLPEDVTRGLLHYLNENCTEEPLPESEVDGITIYEPSPSLSRNVGDSDDTLPEVRTFREMTPKKGPRPRIIDGVVYKGHAAAIYGDGGTAKSTLTMHMGQCVARGSEWLGFETTKTRVLYLDFELDEEEQGRRAYEVAAGAGNAEPPEGFFYLSAAGFSSRVVFKHALKTCLEHGIGMVIVDSLGYALEGDAEGSRDVLKFYREVEGAFRREGITLVIVDHQPKSQPGSRYQDKTMFGSVYKSNSVRSVLQVEPSSHEGGSISLIVRHKKVNFGPKLDPFGVDVTFETDKTTLRERELDSNELVEEGSLNARDMVLMALEEGPMFPDGIADATGLEKSTVKNKLTELRKAGKVENTGNKDQYGSNEVRLVSSSISMGDDDGDTPAGAQDTHADDVVLPDSNYVEAGAADDDTEESTTATDSASQHSNLEPLDEPISTALGDDFETAEVDSGWVLEVERVLRSHLAEHPDHRTSDASFLIGEGVFRDLYRDPTAGEVEEAQWAMLGVHED